MKVLDAAPSAATCFLKLESRRIHTKFWDFEMKNGIINVEMALVTFIIYYPRVYIIIDKKVVIQN